VAKSARSTVASRSAISSWLARFTVAEVRATFRGRCANADLGAWPGPAAGSVNVYSHPTSEALRRGITDEIRRASTTARSTSSCRCSRATTRRVRPAPGRARGAAQERGTTLVDLSVPYDGWLDALAENGIAPAPRPCTAMRVGSPGTATALIQMGHAACPLAARNPVRCQRWAGLRDITVS
jgi:hypothetical protein